MRSNLHKISTPQLLHKALNIKNADNYWEYVHIIQKRGGSLELKACKQLLLSRNPIYRKLGVDILTQLGYKTKVNKGEIIYLLGKSLNNKDTSVIVSAIYGFGHYKSTLYLEKLCNLISHSNQEIKQALAFSLASYQSKKAVDTLIILMKDKDFTTRNWATFSLAQINELNTIKICNALYQNIDDNLEIRGEALLGLALRKDKRVKKIIIEDLQKDFYGSWIFSSIIEMPDKDYLLYFNTYLSKLEEVDKKAFKSEIDEVNKILEINFNDAKYLGGI